MAPVAEAPKPAEAPAAAPAAAAAPAKPAAPAAPALKKAEPAAAPKFENFAAEEDEAPSAGGYAIAAVVAIAIVGILFLVVAKVL